MRIITVSREFGSGGRELGKRLADELGIPCYDKSVLSRVAELRGVTPDHVRRMTESDIGLVFSATIGHSFSAPVYFNDNAIQIIASQHEVIRDLAKEGDCVFIGRGADIVLRDMDPLRIFVYADKDAKLHRCMERDTEGTSEKVILKTMQKIDKERAANYRFQSDVEWGKKEAYNLCINTTNENIKQLVPAIAEYAKAWFAAREK